MGQCHRRYRIQTTLSIPGSILLVECVVKVEWERGAQVPLDPQLSHAAEEGRSAFADARGGARTGALPALRAVIDAVLVAVGEAAPVITATAAGCNGSGKGAAAGASGFRPVETASADGLVAGM